MCFFDFVLPCLLVLEPLWLVPAHSVTRKSLLFLGKVPILDLVAAYVWQGYAQKGKAAALLERLNMIEEKVSFSPDWVRMERREAVHNTCSYSRQSFWQAVTPPRTVANWHQHL